ncbi:sensor histidine kinase [Eisenbergiella massiliensis]|uniref:sensor histidine kinase n=1 Tax=Eisenbergiella massiliensis TaxID=1720294 RepID=UPI0015F2F0F9|nr:histidine kinase [Eisenbergiella massiliensis]
MIQDMATSEFTQIQTSVENYVSECYYASYMIQNSKNVIESMQTKADYAPEQYYAKRGVEAQINVMSQLLSLYPITIYLDEKTLYRDNILFRSLDELEKYDSFQNFRNDDSSYIWLPPEQQRSPYLNHVTTVVPFLRKIGDNRTPVAYQKVSISMDEIGDLMSVLPNGNRQLILYSVLHDTVLVTKSSDETIPLMKINKDTLSQIGNLLEQENWGKLSSKNGLYLSFARPVKGTDWIMIMAISSSYLWSILLSILFIWLLMFLILVLSYRYFEKQYTNQMLRKIYLLEENMNNLLHEEFTQIEYTDKEHDELDYLICYYNSILQKFQTLFYNKIRDEQEKRRLELSLIQEQINPHFLYNTLDLIKWKAIDADAPVISDIIFKLSDFYKLSLNNGREFVTISEEIRHVTDYVQLQNYRFETDIQLIVEMPDELLEYKIPKITLQPLVENSIQHGFIVKEDKNDCFIELYGWREGEDITLLIKDNGAGIPQEQLEHILSSNESSYTHGYGIRNIHERIQLYCGEDYGLSYESRLLEGTSVTVRLHAFQNGDM